MRNQAGFSALEVALVIIAMGFAGGTGYVVLQKQQKDPVETVAAKTAPPTSAKVEDTTAQPAVAERYLIIGEWGVKLPLDDATASTTYILDGQSAYLGVANLGVDCQPSVGGGVAGITRVPRDELEPTSGKPYPETANTVVIGSYRYVFVRNEASCAAPRDDKTELTVKKALDAAHRRLEATR